MTPAKPDEELEAGRQVAIVPFSLAMQKGATAKSKRGH
jgi:hypothetical protein